MKYGGLVGRIWKWKLPSEGGFTDLSVKAQVKNFIDQVGTGWIRRVMNGENPGKLRMKR